MQPTVPPELVDAIASWLTSPLDTLRIALASRAFYGLAVLHLFRHIDISLASAPSLARALKAHPEHAALCRTIVLSPPKTRTTQVVPPSPQAVLRAVAQIFRLLAERGELLSVRWSPATREDESVVFSEKLWTALALNHGSLRELEVAVEQTESSAWIPLAAQDYPNLRRFRIHLLDAHGWDCASVQTMLDHRCPVLEDLALHFPPCCGPVGITLTSNAHPNLKSFELYTGAGLNFPATDPTTELVPSASGETFLVRHPQLERLVLHSEQHIRPAGPNSNLRALSIDQSALVNLFERTHPDTEPTSISELEAGNLPFSVMEYGSHITHLRLVDFPYLSHPMARSTARSIAETLTCLELAGENPASYKILLKYIAVFLQDLPLLQELGIVNALVWPIPPAWTVEQLRALLVILAAVPECPLRVLRFCDKSKRGAALQSDFTRDVGPVPGQLEFIAWEVFRPEQTLSCLSTLFRIQRGKKRNTAYPVSPVSLTQKERRDWTADSILDHLP